MDSRKLILQTAEAAEEYLTTGLNNSERLMNDLKLLAAWVTDIEPGTPGTFAAAVVDAAIKEYGPECDNIDEDLIDDLSTHELEGLKHWADYTFDHAERLLLDIILWDARARAKA